jgi:hypothetical protein
MLIKSLFDPSNMDVGQLENLAALRTLVGYLGEREQCAWWPSAFFAPGSSVFLTPLFPRTQLLAQCTGVTKAAALVHDERIGVGQVYHLFRLPEDSEQGIHTALQDPVQGTRLMTSIESQGAALASLLEFAKAQHDVSIGPVLVGRIGELRSPEMLSVVAFHYHHGFTTGVQTFPYFSGGRS